MFSMNAIRELVRAAIAWVIVRLAAHGSTIRLMNAVYRRLGTGVHAWLQPRYAKLFRDGSRVLADSRWVVTFAQHRVTLPLRREHAWLDWDAALSALGHEPAIKETYRTLLGADQRPDLFVDVGGNYGMHSLLFLVAGVEAVTFEPNGTCHPYFRYACELNGVRPQIEPVALGAAPGELDLVFPERETWLGSLDPAVIAQLRARSNVRTQRVDVRTLDGYEPIFRGRRALIKIDAEDFEVAVLSGADRTLRTHRPLVVFETHKGEKRARVYDLLEERGYRVANLPVRRNARLTMLDRTSVLESPSDDFIAIPAERLDADQTAHPGRLFAPAATSSRDSHLLAVHAAS